LRFNKNVLTQLYKTLWTKRGLWQNNKQKNRLMAKIKNNAKKQYDLLLNESKKRLVKSVKLQKNR
jgi:hypothetical protein